MFYSEAVQNFAEKCTNHYVTDEIKFKHIYNIPNPEIWNKEERGGGDVMFQIITCSYLPNFTQNLQTKGEFIPQEIPLDPALIHVLPFSHYFHSWF